MKLLVATEFPPDAGGGGAAIVRQMLASQGTKADIFWWSCLPPKSSNTDGVTIRKCFCGLSPGKLLPARRLTHLKAFLMEALWSRLAARDLQRTVAHVQPDCVWVIPHNWSILPIHRVLIRKSNPHRFHTTIQDYPDAHGHPKQWGKGICSGLNRKQDDLYRLAASRDATSLPMLADLEARTGARGTQMLHQGLESADFDYLRNSAIRNPQSAIVKITYAGTILVMQEFAMFVAALKKIRRSLPIELHLYGAHSYASQTWFDSEWMYEYGNLPEKELLGELRKCDWGFIPMSLEDHDPRYNRFSFPTKFITYLAAGLPIITLGHPESSVMKMARQYNVGFAISEYDFSTSDLLATLSNESARFRHRPEMVRCAREQFDAEKMRPQLWDCLIGSGLT